MALTRRFLSSLMGFILIILMGSKTGPSKKVPLFFQDSPDASYGMEILEPEVLVLKTPSSILKGDVAYIHLSFGKDKTGNLSQNLSFPVMNNSFPYSDIYLKYRIVAEAELELPGLITLPLGKVSQPLIQGQIIQYSWSVQASETGKYPGVAWFSLHMIPLDQGTETDLPIAAVPFEVKVVSPLGLSANQAFILGILGVVVSLLALLRSLLKKSVNDS